MPVKKLHHELFEKIKYQDGVQDGWHKLENDIPELHILNVLCLKCSFYVLINKTTIIYFCVCFDAPIITKRQDGDQDGRRKKGYRELGL